MNYLLLGGAGFIGSHLSRTLGEQGHEVIIIDSCVTSHEPKDRKNFVKADLRKLNIETYLHWADVVYFLAGSVGVKNIVENSQKTLFNNLELAMKLVPLFEKYQNKVVFTSTSEVYGDGPFAESANTSIGSSDQPRWSYAAAKLSTEFLITTGTFPYTILRLFNVVGQGQLGDFGMVLPRFINAAKNNEDLVIHGTGEHIRSFCHVSDALNMIQQVEKLDNNVFNIGTHYPVTIRYLAERVIKLANSQSKVVCVPLEEIYQKNYGDISRRVPDLTKLKAHIDYNVNYSLDDIIKSML
jgi:UDP-glucose 4-epimerase